MFTDVYESLELWMQKESEFIEMMNEKIPLIYLTHIIQFFVL